MPADAGLGLHFREAGSVSLAESSAASSAGRSLASSVLTLGWASARSEKQRVGEQLVFSDSARGWRSLRAAATITASPRPRGRARRCDSQCCIAVYSCSAKALDDLPSHRRLRSRPRAKGLDGSCEVLVLSIRCLGSFQCGKKRQADWPVARTILHSNCSTTCQRQPTNPTRIAAANICYRHQMRFQALFSSSSIVVVQPPKSPACRTEKAPLLRLWRQKLRNFRTMRSKLKHLEPTVKTKRQLPNFGMC